VLAGVAGTVLVRRSSSGNGRKLGMPKPGSGGSTVKALGAAAKEIGKAGYNVGQLTNEVRRVRERVAKD
jgi:hypothetical protein